MAKEEGEKSNPVADLKWIIIIILALWFISRSGFGLLNNNNKTGGNNTTGSESSVIGGQSESQSLENAKESKWKGMIKINQGNGSSEDYPRYEYITLRNESDNERINITGWSLANGRDRKYYPVNDKQVKGVSNKVTIPKGAKIFVPGGINPQEDIIFGPDEEAIVTTGIPYGVKTSFKENICSGYIQESEDYNYRPSLNNNCPDPQDEEGAKSLDDVCYKFVSRMSSCHTPEFKDVVYVNNEPYTGYVDNAGDLSYACKDYIKKNYNYNSCVINHLADKDFYENKWRIFLNFPWDLWGEDREVITLYDREGKIVDELTYGY